MADTPLLTPSTALSPWRRNLTESNFLKALLGTALVVLVFWLGYYFERNILERHPSDIRFIREASEAAMRYITIPHIIIGFLFMWSSPKNRTLPKRLWVFGLLALGAVFCGLYGWGGGKANTLLYLGVYLCFLVHELRDEAMFYTVLGDAPAISDSAAFARMVRSLIALIVFAIAAFVWALVPFGVYEKKGYSLHVAAGEWSLMTKLIVGLSPLVLAMAGFQITLRRSAKRLGYPNAAALVRAHATMFTVMFGVVGVLGAALVITKRPFSLILFHVVAWYVFASYQLAKHPPKVAPTGWWLWLRTTAKGFKTLHIGMALVLMVLGLVWTLGLGQTPYLQWLLAPDAFLYWTIMHITVSFVPR